jgi:hypothetical protein
VNKQLIENMFDISVTTKDINNFKQSRNFKLHGDKDEAEKVQDFINKLMEISDNNTVSIMTDENGTLDALFLQNLQMKTWYESFPEVLHIDTTFKVNIERYLLFVMLVQNSNLNGVPVGFALVRAETDCTVKFILDEFTKKSDITKTQVIMVDKDLDNIKIIKQIFINAKVFLCTFHVLKYMKTKIFENIKESNERVNCIKYFRELLYTDKDDDEYYIKKLKKHGTTSFDSYLEKNWLNCKEMWQIKYRKNLLCFDTNTNNHLERYNRSVKDYINGNMHLSTTLKRLLQHVDLLRENEKMRELQIKVKTFNSTDCQFLKCFGSQFVDVAFKHIRSKSEILDKHAYAIMEASENIWELTNVNKKSFSAIVEKDLQQRYLCSCKFYHQFRLPCHHIIYVIDRIDNSVYDHLRPVNEIVLTENRWLKEDLIDVEQSETCESEFTQSSEYHVTQTIRKQTLDSREKHNKLKPIITQIHSRITQFGEETFYHHLDFLQRYLENLNINSRQVFSEDFPNNKSENSSKRKRFELSPAADPSQAVELSPAVASIIKAENTPQFKVVPVINTPGRPKGTYGKVSQMLFPSKSQKSKLTSEQELADSLSSSSSSSESSSIVLEKKISLDEDYISSLYDPAKLSVNKTEWLTNLHVTCFLNLLKRNHPDQKGLCVTDKLTLDSFDRDDLKNSIFVDNPNSNHWVTISNINCEDNVWRIYDSLNTSLDSYFQFFTRLLPDKQSVKLIKVSVQKQTNYNDCGLYALAFATTLCYGMKPEQDFYEAKLLREHFNACLETKEVIEFPSTSKKETRKKEREVVFVLNLK